ncbi:MAG: Tim44-like domain-containing protein [Burkholderiaceae bacterium]
MTRFLSLFGWGGAALTPLACAAQVDPGTPGDPSSWPFAVLVAVAAVALVAVVLVWRSRAMVGTADDEGPLTQSGHSQLDPVIPRQYSPKNVGNDASARPWEQSAPPELTQGSSRSAPTGWRAPKVPDGFDAEAFLADSRANFVGLQAAWDRADIPALRSMMTESMLEAIQGKLAERERTGTGGDAGSEVVMLQARLLGIDESPDGYMASVEFSGLMRESADAGPNPFRELWNITRPRNGQGRWLVAGVQALQ